MSSDTTQKAPPRKRETYSWLKLQEVLRECETSEQVKAILKDEIKGRSRLRWLIRINGRLSSLRTLEEAQYLESVAKE